MAYDSDHIRQRQRRRRSRHDKERQREKVRRQSALTAGIAFGVLLSIACGVGLILAQINHANAPITDPTPPPQQLRPGQEESVIHLAFGGDVNITDKVVASGEGNSGYDYSEVFQDVAHVLAGADAAVLNFEGNLCGGPYGSKDTRAPQELANALKDAGVDMLQTANSCTINNGLLGLSSTLDSIRKTGMEPLGAYANAQAAKAGRGFSLHSIGGVKVAFVAFTKGVGNMAMPAGSESCVNLLYTDYTSTYQKVNTEGITKVLRDVALEQPDVTIALLHWGSEYNSQISASQTRIVELMQKEGVDAIIGTHSHYVQKAEFNKEAGTVVAYSLGDFIGDADKAGTNYSLIMDLEITKNHTTGECKITGLDYTPIYIATSENDGVPRMQVLRIEHAMSHFEENGIGKVSQETYNAMKSALGKINSRIPKG
jgi:poly-gamma-glutamate synthesis protein (capsule biosynthesis protein)